MLDQRWWSGANCTGCFQQAKIPFYRIKVIQSLICRAESDLRNNFVDESVEICKGYLCNATPHSTEISCQVLHWRPGLPSFSPGFIPPELALSCRGPSKKSQICRWTLQNPNSFYQQCWMGARSGTECVYLNAICLTLPYLHCLPLSSNNVLNQRLVSYSGGRTLSK